MRQIGLLPQRADAHRLVAYLTVEGIPAQAEEDGAEWAVWVRDEDQLEAARSAYDEYRSNPTHPKFRGVEQTAEKRKREDLEKRQAARQQVVTMGQRWKRPGGTMRRTLTLGVILACGAIGIFTDMGENQQSPLLNALLFCSRDHLLEDWQPVTVEDKLIDLRRGQLWRVLTPALVHYGAMHLAFNMFMFYQLGSIIESRRGSLHLVWLMLAIAIPSNLAQALFPNEIGGGVFFGGLSGVVFGLLGYLWMKSQYDPSFGVMLNRGTLLLALVFLGLGFSGFFNTGGVRMANWAHGVGFATGILIGWLPTLAGPGSRSGA
jgi:GlpG protein